MKLDSIALARYFAFIDTNDLNPRGAESAGIAPGRALTRPAIYKIASRTLGS